MNSLKYRLAILWIAIAALAARELLGLSVESARLEHQAESHLRTLSLAFGGHVSATLQSLDASLRTIRETLPAPVNGKGTGLFNQRQSLLRILERHQPRLPGVRTLAIADIDGEIIATAGQPAAAKIADRAYFRALKSARGFDAETMMISQVQEQGDDHLGLHVAQRLAGHEGGFAGVILAVLDVDAHFGQFKKALHVTPSSAFALLDDDLRLLMRLPHQSQFIGQQPRLRASHGIRRGENGEEFYPEFIGLDGRSRMAVSQRLAPLPLRAVAIEEHAVALAPVQSARQRGLLFLLVLASAGGLATLLLQRMARREARERLYGGIFRLAPEGILITDAQSVIIDANPHMTEMSGFTRAELLGQKPRLLRSARQNAEFYQQMWETLQHHGQWHGELWNRRKDGKLYAQKTSISAMRDESGRLTHYIALCTDITALKSQAETLDQKAHHDPLTGLPNRALFSDRLTQALARAHRERGRLAVCYLDLDEFKPINDQYGHAAGDVVLTEVAGRVKALLRGSDTVARLGGDEFVLILTDLPTDAEYRQAVERMLLAITEAVDIGETLVRVSASIGIALYPRDAESADDLMLLADQAMYEAKRQGKNRYSEYG